MSLKRFIGITILVSALFVSAPADAHASGHGGSTGDQPTESISLNLLRYVVTALSLVTPL